MSSVHVLISIPPHDPNADVNVLAAAFARSPAEVRMKARLALPELWFGDEDAARVQDLAATLQQAGFRVAAVAGDHLAGVPDASVAEGLLLDDAGIVWDIETSAVQMPADAPVLAVYCRPEQPPGEARRISFKKARGSIIGRMTASAMGGVVGRALYNAHAKHQQHLDAMRARRKQNAALNNAQPNAACIDCYAATPEGVLRLSLIEGTIDYRDALGNMAKPTARENTRFLLERIETTFSQVLVDRRLENAAYRPATLAGLVLPALLQKVHPEWAGLDPYDLASRLIYLTGFPPEWATPPAPAEAPPAAPTPGSPPRAGSRTRKSFEG